MKIAVVHGQAHKGSTYHVTQLLLEKLSDGNDVLELDVSGIGDCVGCFSCFIRGEEFCPHHSQMEQITAAIEEADVLIFDSPTYVLGMSGQLKTFFDHLAYRWMSHRPHPAMGGKIGVAVSTAAGAGAGRATKQITTQLFWLAVGKTYRLPATVAAMSWDQVDAKKKAKAEKKAEKIAGSIKRKAGNVSPGIRSRLMFSMMKQMHKKMDYNPLEQLYWKENGWIE